MATSWVSVAGAVALMMKNNIEGGLDHGYRVVACVLWTQELGGFVGSLITVADNQRATTFHDPLRPWSDARQSWDSPYGRLVELYKSAQGAVAAWTTRAGNR